MAAITQLNLKRNSLVQSDELASLSSLFSSLEEAQLHRPCSFDLLFFCIFSIGFKICW